MVDFANHDSQHQLGIFWPLTPTKKTFQPSLGDRPCHHGLFPAYCLLSPLLVAIGVLMDPQDSITYGIHEPPSWNHWFGTSREGYDVFARTLSATQAAFQVVLAATALSLLIGVPLGW